MPPEFPINTGLEGRIWSQKPFTSLGIEISMVLDDGAWKVGKEKWSDSSK